MACSMNTSVLTICLAKLIGMELHLFWGGNWAVGREVWNMGLRAYINSRNEHTQEISAVRSGARPASALDNP